MVIMRSRVQCGRSDLACPGPKDNIDMLSIRKANARRAMAIIREVKVEAEHKLSYLLDGLAVNVADALFEEMWGMDQDLALKHHFNVMRAIKVQSAAYRDEFDRLMDESWRAFVRTRKPQMNDTGSEFAGTLISAYRIQIEGHHKMLLNDIRLRLSCLLNQELNDFPLRPQALYLLFWQAIERLDLDHHERVLLIPLFHRFVMDRYGQVLGVVNRVLITHGVATWVENV